MTQSGRTFLRGKDMLRRAEVQRPNSRDASKEGEDTKEVLSSPSFCNQGLEKIEAARVMVSPG